MNTKKMVMMGIAIVSMSVSAQDGSESVALKSVRAQYEKEQKAVLDQVAKLYRQRLEVLYNSTFDRKDKMAIAKEIEAVEATIGSAKTVSIVGEWEWGANSPVIVTSDGKIKHKDGTGTWSFDAQKRAYVFYWSYGNIDIVRISSDGKSIRTDGDKRVFKRKP